MKRAGRETARGLDMPIAGQPVPGAEDAGRLGDGGQFALNHAGKGDRVSAKVAKPHSGFSNTRSDPSRAIACSAGSTISRTGSAASVFGLTTPTPTRCDRGRSRSTAKSPARGVQNSRKSVPTGSDAKSGSSGGYRIENQHTGSRPA